MIKNIHIFDVVIVEYLFNYVDLIFQHNKNLKISRKQLKELFRFVTSGTHFLLNGTYYDQIENGMASPLGSLLANLFMRFHEKAW